MYGACAGGWVRRTFTKALLVIFRISFSVRGGISILPDMLAIGLSVLQAKHNATLEQFAALKNRRTVLSVRCKKIGCVVGIVPSNSASLSESARWT